MRRKKKKKEEKKERECIKEKKPTLSQLDGQASKTLVT